MIGKLSLLCALRAVEMIWPREASGLLEVLNIRRTRVAETALVRRRVVVESIAWRTGIVIVIVPRGRCSSLWRIAVIVLALLVRTGCGYVAGCVRFTVSLPKSARCSILRPMLSTIVHSPGGKGEPCEHNKTYSTPNFRHVASNLGHYREAHLKPQKNE